GAVCDLGEELGQRGRIVRQVSVDLDDDVVTTFEPYRESGAYGVADADLARPAQHLDVPEPRADLVGEIGRAVGTVVVDDEDVGVGRGRARAVQELDDVLRLLVRGSHDERSRGAGNV